MSEGRREWAERIADQFGVTGAAAIDAIEEGVQRGLSLAKPADEGLRELLRRCRPYVEAAHAGIDTAAERCALRAELDAALSETVK